MSLGWSPHEWDQSPYKETPESPPAPSALWRHKKKMAISEAGPMLSQDTKSSSWYSQPPELWKINFYCLSLAFCYNSPIAQGSLQRLSSSFKVINAQVLFTKRPSTSLELEYFSFSWRELVYPFSVYWEILSHSICHRTVSIIKPINIGPLIFTEQIHNYFHNVVPE